MLGIEPLELRFHFELNKQITALVRLTNETKHDYLAFNIQTSSLLLYTQPKAMCHQDPCAVSR